MQRVERVTQRPNSALAMDSLQLSLVLVASVWAAMNTLIAGYTAVNATRDRIVTGRTDEGIPLSPAHRRAMYRNDWVPLKAALSAVSLAFAGFLIFLPTLTHEGPALRVVCYVAALLPLGGFLGFFVLGLSDRRLILDALARSDADEPAGRGADRSLD